MSARGVPVTAEDGRVREWVGLHIDVTEQRRAEQASAFLARASALLSASRDCASDPVARAVFSSLLRDEVSHARLGWYYLAWRSETWTVAERQRVADRAANFVAHVEVMFGRGRDAPRGARKAARALGVLDTPTQRAAIQAIMEQEVVPGLDGLGLGASHAWRLRKRLAS